MAITVGAGFRLRSPQQNFERDSYSTLEEMKNVTDSSLPDIFIATCLETGKLYIYQKTNDVDAITGKWREVVGSSSIGDLDVSEDEDTTYVTSVEIVEGTSEDLECTKTVTTIGDEVTTIITANADSSDPDTLKAGDIVSIVKEINGIVVYEYYYMDNETIVSPFD